MTKIQLAKDLAPKECLGYLATVLANLDFYVQEGLVLSTEEKYLLDTYTDQLVRYAEDLL